MYSERTKTIKKTLYPLDALLTTPVFSLQKKKIQTFPPSKMKEDIPRQKGEKNHQNNLSYNFYIPRDSRKFLFSATFFAVTWPHVSPVSRGFKDASISNRNTSEHIT